MPTSVSSCRNCTPDVGTVPHPRIAMNGWYGRASRPRAPNVAAIIFTLKFLAETAGRSLEDIENALRNGTFSPSKDLAER